jgi:Uma2 family endonuclease
MSRATHEARWSLDDVQHLVLEGVSWELYEHLLNEIDLSGRRLFLTYDDGELEIMSPLPEHEDPKELISDCIKAILERTDTPARALGQTTFRRKLKKKGLEPDSCFYIQSQPLVIGKKRIRLPKDPPPDLAIEIDITSRSIARLPIYAALDVPEVWRYDGVNIRSLHLRQGRYDESEYSLAFPKLLVKDLVRFIRMYAETGDHTATMKAFRKWLNRQSWIK